MYIDIVPNRTSPPCVLLRESYREGGKIRKRTLANLSHWPPEKVETLRRLLRDEPLVSPQELFDVVRATPHGHVKAILHVMRKTGLNKIIGSEPSHERDIVLALIAERLLHPGSKQAAVRTWRTTTLAEKLGVSDVDEHAVYRALDWLLARQGRIEKKLAKKHLEAEGMALYDLSSSSYYGEHCELAQWGHNRDKRSDVRSIAYGLITNDQGIPVAIQVYPGNTGDPTTVPDQVEKLSRRFGLSNIVIVGDRGMLTQTQIDQIQAHPGMQWITALHSDAIRKLLRQGAIQRSLLDNTHLAETTSDLYPDERLIVCYNPLLAEKRRRTREELLQVAEEALVRIQREVARRTKKPLKAEEIGIKVGRALHRTKMGKHFKVTIQDNHLSFTRRQERIREEEALDGLYVVRTNVPSERLSGEEAVKAYKRLSRVERAFRCLKGVDLRIRPIYLSDEDHVRAHFFLCMLAYYVEWHLRQAWAPLLFAEEESEVSWKERDPVAPAPTSRKTRRKKGRKRTQEDLPVHSFATLLEHLGGYQEVVFRKRGENEDLLTFVQTTQPDAVQKRAFDLLGCTQ